jgi:hypothetical protein
MQRMIIAQRVSDIKIVAAMQVSPSARSDLAAVPERWFPICVIRSLDLIRL